MPNDTPEGGAHTAKGGADTGAPTKGVLIRADNGDVVTFDATGFTLRLSDTVVQDLRQRLAVGADPVADTLDILGDIDAWNLRRDGDWYRFTAQMDPGLPARDYQRRVAGGDIIASAPGPLYAVMSLGGARRAGFNDGAGGFAFHILAPGDDIGAVGLEGTAAATASTALQRLAHYTRDALVAETLLGWRRDGLRGLPMFMVRGETDASATIAELGQGVAYANFLTALDSLTAAAASMGKRAKVVAVGLDFSVEDQTSSPDQFITGLRGLMAKIERDMAVRTLQRPIFVATFEAGTWRITDHAAMRAHWELAWSHGTHSFAFSAPGYMFEQTRFGRPTTEARIAMAEMDAHAIAALSNRQAWTCPLFLLAEYHGREIRVTAQSMSDLVLDDAFGAGPRAGFSVSGTSAAVNILAVTVAPDDPKALILTCDAVPKGATAALHYAFGAGNPSPDPYPANRGGVRDQWSASSRTGRVLHRWALPAMLPLHPGAR